MSTCSLISRITLLGLTALTTQLARAADYSISGPYTHENLSIFLIHAAPDSGGPRYLTLQEAMDQKKVVVYETGNVNELAIENVSPVDIYIQSGDMVKGGRQDRVFPEDFVLPTGSGRVPISSFCVEHGRWSRRGGEASDRFNSSNQSLPMKPLKLAARRDGQQVEVWSEVERGQAKMARSVGMASGAPPSQSPTSMQLALENPKVNEAVEAYVAGLSAIIDNEPDVVGYAFAINGKVNSADVYASSDLFRRMWSKMLRASAVEALTERDSQKTFTPPGISAVRAVLAPPPSAKESTKKVADRLTVLTKDSDKTVVFETRDREANGAWIHRSYVVK